jgi:hypothetical protein
MHVKSAVAVAIFTSFVAAQTTNNSTIVPESVDLTVRGKLRSHAIAKVCGLTLSKLDGVTVRSPPVIFSVIRKPTRMIALRYVQVQPYSASSCADANQWLLQEDLKFNCTCASNHSSPGLEYYKQTLPTFICQEIYEVCIEANQNNKNAQDRCTANQKPNCGTLDPENYTAPAETTSSTASSTPTATASGAGGASGTSPATTSSSGAAAPTLVAREIGTGVLAAGLAAAFGFMI